MVKKVALCSLMHFLVDGLCICCLYLMLSPYGKEEVLALFVTYNVLAFLTQPLTGHLADRLRTRHYLLIVSILLMVVAVSSTAAATLQPSPSWLSWLATVSLGIGNSLFHVWGGKETATQTGNDIRSLGVFVSTGAFGLAVGAVLFSWPLVCAIVIAYCALALCYIHLDTREKHPSPHVKAPAHTLPALTVACAIAAIMAVVMMRSMSGKIFTLSVERSTSVVLLMGAVAMAGKMAGGFIARRIGIVWSAAVLVVAITLCYAMRSAGTAPIIAGLFLVNCTMPITLYLANVVLPGKEGLAFGLLAAALIPGYLLG